MIFAYVKTNNKMNFNSGRSVYHPTHTKKTKKLTNHKKEFQF